MNNKRILFYFSFLLNLKLFLSHHQLSFRTCSTVGFNFLKALDSSQFVKSCDALGSRVLVSNKWLKVVSHNYLKLNAPSIDAYFSWDLTKIIVEFFDEHRGEMPIGIFDSSLLISDCNLDCLMNQRQFGLNKTLMIRFMNDIDSNVAYISYPKANLSLYVRKVVKGWNFGIKLSNETWSLTTGTCLSKCSADNKISKYYDCLIRTNVKQSLKICLKAFDGLDMNEHVNKSNIIMSCAKDVALWQDPLVSLDHRWSFIDQTLLEDDFKFVDTKRLLTMGLISLETARKYQKMLKLSKCYFDYPIKQSAKVKLTFKVDLKNWNSKLNYKTKQKPVNSTKKSRSDFMNTSKTNINLTSETFQAKRYMEEKKPLLIIKPRNVYPSLSVFKTILASYSSKAKIAELLNESYVDSLAWVDESPEYDYMCTNQNLTTNLNESEVSLPHPINKSLYIQCDSLAKAYTRVCPHSYTFTQNLKCEKEDLNEYIQEQKLKNEIEMLLQTSNLSRVDYYFANSSNAQNRTIKLVNKILGIGTGVSIMDVKNSTQMN